MTDFFTDLATTVEYELEACIGCHLCMAACPLPDAPLIQIGELNAVTAGAAMSRGVQKFALDCTQCGACVPVCPADLSRMRMVLATKLRVEEPPPDTPVRIHEGKNVSASEWTVASLAATLAELSIFKNVEESRIRALIPRVQVRRFRAGSVVICEGEYSNTLRVVVSGIAEASVITADERRTRLLRISPGRGFGESGILSDRPNPATVTALEDLVVLEISEAATRRLMAESTAFNEVLASHHTRWEFSAHCRQIDLFKALPDEAFAWLADHLRVRPYERGEVIAAQNEPSTSAHLVLFGFVKVCRRDPNGTERVLTYERDGGFFSDWGLLTGGPRGATLVANTQCEMAELDLTDFHAFLNHYPDLGQRFEKEAARQYRSANPTGEVMPTSGNSNLKTLLDEGVLQSHSLLVIDERLCIDCNNCVDACVQRHGHPRLERRGLTVGPYLIATACRHCDDPLCLLCPVDGIVRAPDGQIEITTECIGCGVCAERCPYDNIRMADKQDPKDTPPRQTGILDLLRGFGGSKHQAPITFNQQNLNQKVAVKCDLCVGYADGPACVRNCPTGAAFRTDGAEFFGDGDEILMLPTVTRPR